ncbi:hypothetical protein RCG19_15270 [Neobacillus sp. OS1-2]|nr:hypothetical protein [Neobacillus sp. OS1-2]WML38553.1 hypothetical protein RCG19_15270 [Neobacillus sp. OS1-2]
MMKEKKNEKVMIVTNEAIRGKPYLDIDRVILEGKTADSAQKERDNN